MNTTTQKLPNGWKWVKLGDVCEVTMGQSPSSSTYRKSPEGIPFFQGKADFGKISPNPTTWCIKPKKIANVGDILISVRAPVGPTNIANFKCCIGRGLAAVSCNNDVSRDFILLCLKKFESNMSNQGAGSTFKAITVKQLKCFLLPMPIELSEQKRIATILNEQMATIEQAKQAATEVLEAIDVLPSVLLQKAFNGEL